MNIPKFTIIIPPRNTISVANKNISEFNATEIIDGLWLGGEDDLIINELNKRNITYILNITHNIHLLQNDNIDGKQIKIKDDSNENIGQYFDECSDLINNLLNNNRKILVHCQKGLSRSPSIIIAYLMKYHFNNIHEKYNSAFNFVKEKRIYINPNIGFILDLQKYNEYLNNLK